MSDTQQTITYEQVAYMQRVQDQAGKQYFTLGAVTNPAYKNTLAVTPVGGDGRTMFFCQTHQFAYGLREACLDCRMQLVTEPIG